MACRTRQDRQVPATTTGWWRGLDRAVAAAGSFLERTGQVYDGV
ncbi:hypothetical protein [Intrasporangium sp.]|nr:hypothetical protein [Intrasporangium sp.]